MKIEGVGNPYKEIKQRADINSLRNLRIAPPGIAQGLYLLVGDAIGVTRECANKLQQQPLGWHDGSLI